MFFLNQTVAGTLIGVDKSADLAFGVGFEKNMTVILIVIPLLKRNLVIRCNILENFSGSGRNRFIQHLSSVFNVTIGNEGEPHNLA